MQNEDLGFCKGIDENDEPDLWEKSFDGEITIMDRVRTT